MKSMLFKVTLNQVKCLDNPSFNFDVLVYRNGSVAKFEKNINRLTKDGCSLSSSE